MPRKKEEIGKFSLTLEVNDKEYSAKGNTILEALEKVFEKEYFSISTFPKIAVKTKCIVSVESKGRKSRELSLHPIQVKRLVVNKIARLLLEKRLMTFFA